MFLIQGATGSALMSMICVKLNGVWICFNLFRMNAVCKTEFKF